MRKAAAVLVFTIACQPTPDDDSGTATDAATTGSGSSGAASSASTGDVPTTGGTRNTALSSPVTGNLGADSAFNAAFTCGSPQAKTTTLRTIQGK